MSGIDHDGHCGRDERRVAEELRKHTVQQIACRLSMIDIHQAAGEGDDHMSVCLVGRDALRPFRNDQIGKEARILSRALPAHRRQKTGEGAKPDWRRRLRLHASAPGGQSILLMSELQLRQRDKTQNLRVGGLGLEEAAIEGKSLRNLAGLVQTHRPHVTGRISFGFVFFHASGTFLG